MYNSGQNDSSSSSNPPSAESLLTFWLLDRPISYKKEMFHTPRSIILIFQACLGGVLSVTVNQPLFSSHLCCLLRTVLVTESNDMSCHCLKLGSVTKLNLLIVTSFTCCETINLVSIVNFMIPRFNASTSHHSHCMFSIHGEIIFGKQKYYETTINQCKLIHWKIILTARLNKVF